MILINAASCLGSLLSSASLLPLFLPCCCLLPTSWLVCIIPVTCITRTPAADPANCHDSLPTVSKPGHISRRFCQLTLCDRATLCPRFATTRLLPACLWRRHINSLKHARSSASVWWKLHSNQSLNYLFFFTIWTIIRKLFKVAMRDFFHVASRERSWTQHAILHVDCKL